MTRTSGNLRRRVLRHHVPLALASGAVLVLLMGLAPFDANRYAHVDIFSGALPEQRERGQRGPMDHGRGQPAQHRAGGGQHSREQQGRRHGSPQEPGGQHEPRQREAGDERVSHTASPARDRSFERRFSVATGYVALALLALTLLIGPANLLLRRRNPVSSYLRRDAGTWTAIFSAVHVIYGLQLHGTGRVADFLDFFVADGRPLTNSFGWGNWTGLAALVIVAGLLALSSDAALRRLKARSWKRLQRLNYALFALVIAHAFFYGALLRTDSPYTLLLLVSLVAVLFGQAVGIALHRRKLYRRRYVRETAGSA
jgi:sulfoxide reductase heme-binding subunit YedZ